MNSGKLILLLIAMGMIGLVLLLGYKLDMYEEKRKRKEKNTKKHNDDEIENSYTDFNPLRSNHENEINQTSTFANTSFDLKKVTAKSNKYSEELDKTAVIERVDLSKLENTEESKFYEKLYEEPEFKDDIDEEFEEDEIYDYEDINSSTMVFDTAIVNEELEVMSNIKGYDFDEEDVKEAAKSKVAAKKTTTKKTATKKTETKSKTKTTRKTVSKKEEDKTKVAKKTATKKSTTKNAASSEKKPKTTAKSTTRKTTNKVAKSTKTNTKK